MSLLDDSLYKQLEQTLGSPLLFKASKNIRFVESLRSQGDTWYATVRDELNPGLVFQTKVTLRLQGGHVEEFQLACNCSHQPPCVHAASLLLMVLVQPETRSTSGSHSNIQLQSWLAEFRNSAQPPPVKASRTPLRDTLHYRLVYAAAAHTWLLQLMKCSKRKHGADAWQHWTFAEYILLNPPKFLQDNDLALLSFLYRNCRYSHGSVGSVYGYILEQGAGSDAIQRALATGRLVIRDEAYGKQDVYNSLTAGEERSATLQWRRNGKGQIVPRLDTGHPADLIMTLEPPWYLDPVARQVGCLSVPFEARFLSQLIKMPPLQEYELSSVAAVLNEVAPAIQVPDSLPLRVIDAPLQPVLSLGTLTDTFTQGWHSYRYGETSFDYAALSYRYGEVEISAESGEQFLQQPDGESIKVIRRPEQEEICQSRLKTLGLTPISPGQLYLSRPPSHLPTTLYGLDHEAAWADFMQRDVPLLQSEGWDVWVPPVFRHRYLHVEGFEADLHEDAGGWFDLDLGVIVEGQRIPLAPLVYELFRRDSRWMNLDKIDSIADDERIILVTARGERLLAPAERLKPLARMLVDLFDSPATGTLRFSRLDAPRLAELADLSRWEFRGMEAVTQLAERLQTSQGVHAMAPPEGFALQLRPYQLEGLAWLQFLREQKLAGILADDMGLGKTAQALSHLLLEKEAGRMDLPSLVVMPTSLIYNWRREAEKFAPGLRVLSLHGTDRHDNFAAITESDVVLTTYPLLWRDEESLCAHEYHLLILDEAQTVKNVNSQAAQIVRKLSARHRLCLTGTPLENHLGELWTQFDFLLPGFLRDSKSFTSTWRTPIEKHGDKLRRNLLARRVKPFILRRRKEDVARELPEKTIIVRTVELEGGQRDLYEVVRTAMNEKVQQAIANQGFARSQIVILDALLKLRQVCCDPRLVKIPSASKVKQRAKLELLMDMVPELVSEGRRLLIFSQFTSMLALIEIELKKHKLGYVQLTGDTRDRETVVGRFQAGEVPIFLISLKAGGVGLNLTAADTVIHFDPWWNPAVENQATDRAHRIGQTRQVFVYKLVVAGSIEEKILLLQEKKAELAAGVLSEDTQALAKFGEADIKALLEPLPRR